MVKLNLQVMEKSRQKHSKQQNGKKNKFDLKPGNSLYRTSEDKTLGDVKDWFFVQLSQ